MTNLYGDTPFKRHLSFLDRTGEGVLRPYQTLRSALSIGLNFPAACLYTARIHWRFGNVGFGGFGGINIHDIPKRKERSQLQNVPLKNKNPALEQQLYTRANLMKLAYGNTVFGKLRIVGFFLMAANEDGLVTRKDLELFQKGELLPELERRRKFGKENKIPFKRGGPLIVSGHSWFVNKLFDVQVYQDPPKKDE